MGGEKLYLKGYLNLVFISGWGDLLDEMKKSDNEVKWPLLTEQRVNQSLCKQKL
jgi:hypothetical protein